MYIAVKMQGKWWIREGGITEIEQFIDAGDLLLISDDKDDICKQINLSDEEYESVMVGEVS